MVASETYAEFLREQLAPLGHVSLRRMLYFRVDDHNREIFKEAESSPPLNYAKGGAMIDLSFWRVPERLFDEPDELIAWARAALAAAHRVAVKREPATPKRQSTLRARRK